MRAGIFLVLAILLPGAALAATDSAPDKCTPLAMVESVQMTRAPDRDGDLVPVTVNGAPEQFLLDTGGMVTQIHKSAARDLKLPVRQDDWWRGRLQDVAGNRVDAMAQVRQFGVGGMSAEDLPLPISTALTASDKADGLLALDLNFHRDMDVDFSNDTLKFFSRDHCPGAGLYWKPSAFAVLPFELRNNHIYLTVTLDGHEVNALIDTGATTSFMSSRAAERIFGLTMGDAATPVTGFLNADAAHKIYSHPFKALTFKTDQGTASVANPRIIIARNETHDGDLLIGMDVLRLLHVYFAFGESKLYLSPAPGPDSIPAADAAAPPAGVADSGPANP